MSKSIKWMIEPIQKLKLIQRLKDNPTFKLCFKKNITKQFITETKRKCTDPTEDNHIVITVFGETGSNKSGSMQSLAFALDPSFTAQNICFTNQEMLDRLKETSKKKGGFYIRDESIKQFGHGSYRVELEIDNASKTLRQERKSLIFICPEEIHIGSSHYILHVIQKSECRKYTRIGLIDPLTKAYLGYIIIKLNWNDQIWQDYQKKKDNFTKSIQNQNIGVLDYEKLAKDLIKEKAFNDLKRKKQKKVYIYEKYPTLTTNEKDMILTKTEMIQGDDK